MADWALPITLTFVAALDGVTDSWSASCLPLADAMERLPVKGYLLPTGGYNLVRRFRRGPVLGLMAVKDGVVNAITGMEPTLRYVFLATMPALVQDEPYELPFSV